MGMSPRQKKKSEKQILDETMAELLETPALKRVFFSNGRRYGLLTQSDLSIIETYFWQFNGVTSAQVVATFVLRGVKFSSATFRKYGQMGLVEKSTRVGLKGKHRGSRGLFPLGTIARVNFVKNKISGDTTLEELKGDKVWLSVNKLEEVVRLLGDVTELSKADMRKVKAMQKTAETIISGNSV